MRFVNKIM